MKTEKNTQLRMNKESQKGWQIDIEIEEIDVQMKIDLKSSK